MRTGEHLKIRSLGDNTLGVTLEGNPKKPEPESFRVHFPGGHVDIMRNGANDYWIHIGVNQAGMIAHRGIVEPIAHVEEARIDVWTKPMNETEQGDLGHPDFYHAAFRVKGGPKKKEEKTSPPERKCSHHTIYDNGQCAVCGKDVNKQMKDMLGW